MGAKDQSHLRGVQVICGPPWAGTVKTPSLQHTATALILRDAYLQASWHPLTELGSGWLALPLCSGSASQPPPSLNRGVGTHLYSQLLEMMRQEDFKFGQGDPVSK